MAALAVDPLVPLLVLVQVVVETTEAILLSETQLEAVGLGVSCSNCFLLPLVNLVLVTVGFVDVS